ncbi:hypothetical protein F4679DRAFT_580312 [Xylaria curta]|nr:hypothetical protein F4679DRAFT_580312 [Xylaria curta]
MCFEISVTYACGHWDKEVTPCQHRGNKMRCQIRRLWPRIYTRFCRQSCRGVRVQRPSPQYSWKLVTFPPPPVSEYPRTAIKQRRPAVQGYKSVYGTRLNRISTRLISRRDAQASHPQISRAPVTNASDPAPSTNPSVLSRGQTGECLLTRWHPFQPTFCRGTPSKVAGGNNEAELPTYQHGYRVPEAQMYEKGQKPLSNVVHQDSQYHVKAVKEVDGAKDSGNQATSVPHNPCMMDGRSSDTSETMTNGDNSEDGDGGAKQNINGANGLMDTHTTTHDNSYSGGRTAVDNSLRSFYLGLQWQVPGSHVAQSNEGSESGEASISSNPTPDIIAPPPTPEPDTTTQDQVMADWPQAMDLANLCGPHGRITGSSNESVSNGSRGHESCAQHRATTAPLTAALNCHNCSTAEPENSNDDVVIIPDTRGGLSGEGTRNHQNHGQRKAALAPKRYYADFEIDEDGCFVLKECLDRDGL